MYIYPRASQGLGAIVTPGFVGIDPCFPGSISRVLQFRRFVRDPGSDQSFGVVEVQCSSGSRREGRVTLDWLRANPGVPGAPDAAALSLVSQRDASLTPAERAAESAAGRAGLPATTGGVPRVPAGLDLARATGANVTTAQRYKWVPSPNRYPRGPADPQLAIDAFLFQTETRKFPWGVRSVDGIIGPDTIRVVNEARRRGVTISPPLHLYVSVPAATVPVSSTPSAPAASGNAVAMLAKIRQAAQQAPAPTAKPKVSPTAVVLGSGAILAAAAWAFRSRLFG